MQIPEYITKQEVQRVCKELGLRDWSALTDTEVPLAEAEIIQSIVGGEAMEITVDEFQQGLEVELEHGVAFPDTNVTNNHPLLTGMIVTAHLKESLDYYLRLDVAELEGGLLKAAEAGNAEKLARVYSRLVDARYTLARREKDRLAAAKS